MSNLVVIPGKMEDINKILNMNIKNEFMKTQIFMKNGG